MDCKCSLCGCQVFVTQPNQYDVFEVINDKICWIHSETIDMEFKMYCRDCSEEVKFDDSLFE